MTEQVGREHIIADLRRQLVEVCAERDEANEAAQHFEALYQATLKRNRVLARELGREPGVVS